MIHAVYNNISRVRRGHSRNLLSLQRNRTDYLDKFHEWASRAAVVDSACVCVRQRWSAVKGARGEKEKKEGKKKTSAREVYRTRCYPSFCAVVVHGAPLARCSLRRGIMHLAARRVPFRVTPLSRALIDRKSVV